MPGSGGGKKREVLKKRALGKLRCLQTNEVIVSFVGYVIGAISEEEEIDLLELGMKTEDERSIALAILEQMEIG